MQHAPVLRIPLPPDSLRVAPPSHPCPQIDDGLELRKASFEALDILLEACPEALDKTRLLGHLQDGEGGGGGR